MARMTFGFGVASLGLSLMFGFSLALSGCGYTLRGNTRPFFDQKHIRTLYVAPVKNNSFKPGVEIVVYNALRKRVAQGGYVRIVDSPAQADAQFVAAVQQAGYTPFALTSVKDIGPINSGPSSVQVASLYEATLQVQFALKGREESSLWSETLTRTKRFAASTYFGAAGSTSALINESEFERTLLDLSVSIVTDAEESINTLF